jgi:predicted ribosome quality control (RQC) complex YloA/Tae2 family protein
VHNNYFFLRALAEELKTQIHGWQIESCYTQDKDELILIFRHHEEIRILRAHLHPSFCCLYFPSAHTRAKKNTVDLFKSVHRQSVSNIISHSNERAFSLELSNGELLTFKMFGNRSNVLLFRDGTVREIFRSNLKQDSEFTLEMLDRELDLSKEAFLEADGNPSRFMPVLGKILKSYLFEQGYLAKDLDEQYQMILELQRELQKPDYFLVEWQEQIHLSLVPLGLIRDKFDNPVEALNTFFLTYLREGQLKSEKERAIRLLSRELDRGLRYVDKNKRKLAALTQDTNYRKLADLIMANLHVLSSGQKEAVLDDFYHPGEQVKVKLKPTLSPQKNAEVYYRKAKNQHIETERLEKNIKQKEAVLASLESQLEEIQSAESVKELRAVTSHQSVETGNHESLPYHIFHWQGFQVWLGKSGKSNDEMLRRSRKNDLWLHAKDVAGAHVIIRENPGTNFPSALKEKAASLAAYHSKRRTDSLCPVISTPRKYVRKRKGSPPGAVVVDREEEVLLVEPADWN